MDFLYLFFSRDEINQFFSDFFKQAGAAIAIICISALIVFLIIRELICWFWKINAGLKELSEVNDNLSKISKALEKISNTMAKNQKALSASAPKEKVPEKAKKSKSRLDTEL